MRRTLMGRTLWTATMSMAVAAITIAGPYGTAEAQQQQNPPASQRQEQMRQQQPRQTKQSQAQRGQSRDQQAANRDTMIENRIVRRLAEHAYMGKDFRIQVNDGVATLSGTVPSARDRDRIIRIVRQMPGVDEVQANFRIAPATRVTEPAIADAALAQQTAQRIASALQGAKAGEDWWMEGWRVEGPDNRWNFTVEADNGNIYLEGEVPRLSMVRTAVESALKVNGVRSVRSDLDVERFAAGAPYGHGYGYDLYGYGLGYGYPYWGYPAYGYGSDADNGYASPALED